VGGEGEAEFLQGEGVEVSAITLEGIGVDIGGGDEGHLAAFAVWGSRAGDW
jgi:hypothetical protein